MSTAAHSDVSAKHERLQWMDVLRAHAILLVVLFHTETQIQQNLPSFPYLLHVFNEAVGPFRMPLLMMISGMLLRWSESKPLAIYVSRKLAKIGWPYLVWSLLFLLLLTLTSEATGNDVGAADYARIFYDPPVHMWYLAYLLMYYLACLIIKGKVRLALMPICLVLADTIPDGKWGVLLYLFAFFLFGDFITRQQHALTRWWSNRLVVTGCALLTAVTAICAAAGVAGRYDPRWAVGVASAIVVMKPVCEYVAKSRFGPTLAAVGNQTLVFYVSHFAVIIVVFNILERFGVTNSVLLIVILPLAALGSGCLLIRMRRHPLGRALFEYPLAESRGSSPERKPAA